MFQRVFLIILIFLDDCLLDLIVSLFLPCHMPDEETVLGVKEILTLIFSSCFRVFVLLVLLLISKCFARIF